MKRSGSSAREREPLEQTMFEISDVVALMRYASVSTTYTPALLKTLARRVPMMSGPSLPLAEIGHELLRLYWNQAVVYHLRQAAVVTKEPEPLRAIRAAAERHDVHDLDALAPSERETLARKMTKMLTIDGLDRFHASKPAGMLPLFTWTKGDVAIELSDASRAFLTTNASALEVIANYRWAGYLEKINVLAPGIIEKVQRDGARRGSLAKYQSILTETDEPRCFYCERNFDARSVVDHVIPWSYLLTDDYWDLVLACVSCQTAKADRLPDARFITKLVATNARRNRGILEKHHLSPIAKMDHVAQLYAAAVANEWPGPWAPKRAAT